MVGTATGVPDLSNETVTRQNLREVWNSDGDVDKIEEFVTDDFVYHNPTISRDVRGPDGYREFVSWFLTGFSNVENEVEDVVAEGDEVAARYTTRATHVGEVWGIEPTNEDVVIRGTLIDHFRDGKIEAQYVNDDALGLLVQLGAVEPPEG